MEFGRELDAHEFPRSDFIAHALDAIGIHLADSVWFRPESSEEEELLGATTAGFVTFRLTQERAIPVKNRCDLTAFVAWRDLRPIILTATTMQEGTRDGSLGALYTQVTANIQGREIRSTRETDAHPFIAACLRLHGAACEGLGFGVGV